MDEKALFAQRLKAAMLKAGYDIRPITLEKKFNSKYWGRPVSFQAARAWLEGRAIPTQDKLLVLAELLNVEPQVLRYGEQAAKKIKDPQILWPANTKHPEQETFRSFMALSAAHKKMVRDMITALATKAKR